MTTDDPAAASPRPSMRTLRFHEYGEPDEVLRLEDAPVPDPAPGRIRVRVIATGLAPADWALCRGLFAGELPRGIGCDVAGTVEAIGEGANGVELGQLVFGTADWANSRSAGASEQAVMNRWFPIPEGLDPVTAAALPMTVDTANGHLHWLGAEAGMTILIHGAGSTIGFAAVQIALRHGLKVVATAGETYAEQLRGFGAQVTPYGEGLADRALKLNGGVFDLALDAAPVGGALPELIRTVGGNARLVMTVSDFAAADELGVRTAFHEDLTDRVEALPEFAQCAADGTFVVPIAATFALDEWHTALDISQSGHARGKLLLLPGVVKAND
ncbi:NADP-dependent oxidoreductase [Gryllotalpicola reticulitermitis]|uniref:NADP-dependent oxidoreductase n=1 Tax=Gryllotalpicola reticulitermitis TaxID=1184153 RepID=A0ABV8QBB0_9MICO